MRKIICLLLCFVIALSLSSCGKEKLSEEHIALQMSYGPLYVLNDAVCSSITIAAVPRGDYLFESASVSFDVDCNKDWFCVQSRNYWNDFTIYIDKNGFGEITIVLANNKETSLTLPQSGDTISLTGISYHGTVR